MTKRLWGCLSSAQCWFCWQLAVYLFGCGLRRRGKTSAASWGRLVCGWRPALMRWKGCWIASQILQLWRLQRCGRSSLCGHRSRRKGRCTDVGAEVCLLSETPVSMPELALQSTDETNSGACRRRGLLPADASHRLFDLRQLCGKYNRLLEKLPAKIVGRLLGFRKVEI